MDLLISGKPRKNFGKGNRAVIYSAFTIGLMKYCTEKQKPHARFVLLDSPLTTHKDKDKPAVSGDVAHVGVDEAFKSLAKWPLNQQIIILENKDPPKDILSLINYLHFSGVPSQGRAGFYTESTNPPEIQERK